MLTDGYADQFGGTTCRKFYMKNFKKLLLKIHDNPLKNYNIC